MVQAKPSEETSLSIHEVTARIRAMSAEDKLRFIKDSNYLSFGDARSPADLRQEAIRRALDGTRKCPANLSITGFLRGAMRSIAWADRKAGACRPKIGPVPNTGPASRNTVEIADPRLSAEDRILEGDRAEEIRDSILALFEDDAVAHQLAQGMMDGEQGIELRELLELSETEFASKRRLVRRRIDVAFPKGWRP
ncbi:RNA polymerase subunit sigma-24 [Bradyrhizobium xenonodulans]|uniref:RNA polymerase subunit sigma-24 n=1 Tax=Bradyrhizobium xenonodulans TaxID=2736875 RepID=A0ABY7MZY4_9BRAD|nr:RNA polymerase subunit sigma-24 [Bradyrhizobium xenonodulans]WBL82127.1 RNA polymerase subunit sigma-24 [Bradyrhizobium xenonodulans]